MDSRALINITISEERFIELYPSLFEHMDIFREHWVSDSDFIKNYLPSKLWRMNNLYTILDKDGEKVKFRMNEAQHKVYSAVLQHPRLIILKSRQQGISTFWLLYFFDEAIFHHDLNLGLMAQGLDEASTLLTRVKFAWYELDESIKAFMGISKGKENSKEFSFSNNSTLFVRTSFRSATLQGLHISELGKIANKTPEKAKETNTGTLQTIKAGNVVAVESTAEGDNMFKAKWDQAYYNTSALAPKDFSAVFLSWLEDPDCWLEEDQELNEEQEKYFAELELTVGHPIAKERKNFWVMQFRELGDDIFQEYPSTPEEAFAAVRDGTYYAKQYQECVVKGNREIYGLYDSNLVVDVVMDLGMNDDFVLGFFQAFNGEERLIHDYHNSGEGLEHYVNYIEDTGYTIGDVVVPHDIRVKELGTGQSRLHRLRELGVRRIRVLPRVPIIDGIEAVRRLVPYLWIDPSCRYTKNGFLNYSKEWDEKLQVWKDKPKHDEFSHPMDMMRYRAMSKVEYKKARFSRKAKRRRTTSGFCVD